MNARLNAKLLAPEGYQALRGLQEYVEKSGLEHSLIELVKIRASQINGCAFCIAMHTGDARKMGETDERMHLLHAWRETPIFTARERAAMAWTEAVTLLNEGHVPDEVYDEARKHFSEKELADLNFAVIAINAWNRIAVSFRMVPVTKAKVAA